MKDEKTCSVKPQNNGMCCCNCINQIELKKHPMNTEFGKGGITETCGWVCINPELGEGKSGIYSDHKHGMCECYEPREKKFEPK